MDKKSQDYVTQISDVRPLRERHWLSLFHQISFPARTEDVHSVLEFGPGRGFMGNALKHYGIDYACSDVADHGAKPDYISDIMSFDDDKKFDLVCAFQALEHNPPETFVPHLKKMASISNKYVYVSLPYSGRWLSFNISVNLPKIDRNFTKTFALDRLFPKKRPLDQYRKSENPYRHHWFEVGEPGFKKKDLPHLADQAGLKITKMHHSSAFPYHIFLVMERKD